MVFDKEKLQKILEEKKLETTEDLQDLGISPRRSSKRSMTARLRITWGIRGTSRNRVILITPEMGTPRRR
jgi:hypothetical protein